MVVKIIELCTKIIKLSAGIPISVYNYSQSKILYEFFMHYYTAKS